ncbi:G-protein-coupled receptor family protein [Histomonas meleagridis]|uniref:G-protein-coupled receptor family protein n=1 Tax=Histomonas meleagridis TaxID=135588 RepID=UPI00355A2076|nr:G-protein-coupled receptor family protein [Histomonas meleagridis]KAH0799861.1 G-protein-coupled receptor family protein [Histomonas meleagridis]
MTNFRKITLAGFDETKLADVKFVASYHGDQVPQLKPHKLVDNWKYHYKIPWVCFLDVAIFILYAFLAVFHQESRVVFTQDFSNAISDYFLGELDFPEQPDGIPIGVGQLYFIGDFKFIFTELCSRFFTFHQSFPVSFTVDSLSSAEIEVAFQGAESFKLQLVREDIDLIIDQICKSLDVFSSVEVIADYHIQVNKDTYDYRMTLSIKGTFTRDLTTDTIFLDIEHSRIQENPEVYEGNAIFYLYYSLPFLIIVLNVITLLILIKNTISLYKYSKHRSMDINIPWKEIFKKKFDKWDIFTLVTHSVSIASSTLYIQVGQDVTKEVSPFLYVIAISTLFHSFTLIRYLKLNKSTNLIIHVLLSSTVKVMQFLVGCIPFFFGFWAFGMCFFGHLNDAFASPLQCASFLFCVMHGDSIKEVYDATTLQTDMSPYVGFSYTSLWVAFALLLMFNITISIVQEVLTVETYKSLHKKEDDGKLPSFNELANNVALRNLEWSNM